MTLTNSKPVALERRMDLASLFCMIGRHGPAVAVAVIAMISVLAAAAFVIYRRSVRAKRRGKATDASAGRDAKSRGEEPDAAVSQEEEEEVEVEEEDEEADMIPAESTEVEDGASPDLPKDPDLFQNHLKIRQRCAAAEDSVTVLKAVEKKPPLHSSPRRDNEIPEDRHTASGGSQSPEWDTKPHRAAETYRDEVGQLQHLGQPETEKEDVFDSHQDVKDDTLKDEIEVIHHNDSCFKESTDDEKKQEEEQVFKAEYTEVAEDVTTDEGSPHINARQEEENVQCVMKNLLSQTPRVSENGDHVGLQDDKTTQEVCVSAEERNGSSPLLTSLNQTSELEKVDGGDEGLPGAVICPVSSPFQQPQRTEKNVKDETSPLFENEPDQCGKNETGTAAGLAEEQNILVEDSQAPSLYKDQQGGQVITEDFERGVEGIKAIATSPDIDAFDATCVTSRTVAAACDDDQVTAPAETEEAPHPQLSSVCHNQPNGLYDEGFDESNIASSLDTVAAENAEGMSRPFLSSSHQDKQNGQTVNNEATDESNIVSDLDTAAWDDGDVTSVVNKEEISCPLTPPVCQNQQRGQTANTDAFDEASVNAGPDTLTSVEDEVTAPVTDEKIYCPVLPSGQTRDNEGLEEESVTADTAAVTCGGDEELSSFLKDQQSSQTENMDNISSPGVDEESGISSCIAFSPDSEEPSEDLGIPVMDFGHHLIEAHHGIFSTSVTNEDGSIPSVGFVDKAICVSFGGSEDVCGQDIEDGYHGEFDHFTVQIAANIGSRADEAQKQADDKDVDVSEIKEEKEVIRLEKTAKAQAENEDYERTEISIMEATMDSNEWIEDINYQVPPWMNLSLKSLDQDHTKTEKLQQDFTVTSATTGAAGTDTRDADIQFLTEDKQSSTLSVADDNNKKVAAVPPMPQNVNVTFCVHYLTRSPHQTVAVTGNQQELGSWKGFVPLERAKDGYWASVIGLPAESHVEWKFVVVDNNDEVCRWEECGNRYLETGCGDDLYVHKWWGLL